jgi:hypothetical protein
MPKRIDLVGQKFGRLTVISFAHGGNNAFWNCICECGNEKKTNSVLLKSGAVKSCGCLHVENGKIQVKKANAAFIVAQAARKAAKLASPEYLQAQEDIKRKQELRFHGLIKHPLYTCWRNMRRRCYEPTRKDYKQYGGRGIKVCDRWLEAFKNFYDDVIDLWAEGLTIDRIDVNGNYEPDNVRFVTWKEQANNKQPRRNI